MGFTDYALYLFLASPTSSYVRGLFFMLMGVIRRFNVEIRLLRKDCLVQYNDSYFALIYTQALMPERSWTRTRL